MRNATGNGKRISGTRQLDANYLLIAPFAIRTSDQRRFSDAYYCAECTRLEKDRDGCPKIVNLGASRTDLFYERRRLGASLKNVVLAVQLRQFL